MPAEPAALPDTEIGFIEQMQAKLVSDLPKGDVWKYEIKLDGYRALVLKAGGRVTLLSRNNHELNSRFPSIANSFEGLEDNTILDGEIVALDEWGRPSFNRLQNDRPPIFFYAFDLLAFRGKSLLGLPLRERRDLLARLALSGLGDPVRLSQTLDATPAALIAAAKQQGLEGLVAKRSDSVYEPGRRSGAWVKYRTVKGQELVIGGYIPGKNWFDSLLAGYYDSGKLLFVGKIKNGFVPATRRQVFERFKGLGTGKCPFANLPEPKGARRGEAITEAVMRKCCWLKPRLVAEIAFADWTAANHLRHSRFIALRDDKDAREVRHEVAV